MSTRYGRLKQLEPVGPGGEALLDYAVYDAHRAGFSRVLLIIREELEDLFLTHVKDRWPEQLEVVFHFQKIRDLPGIDRTLPGALMEAVERREKPWGTAHALLTSRAHLPYPFLLLNADDFYGGPAFSQAREFRGTLEDRFQAGLTVDPGEDRLPGAPTSRTPPAVAERPTFGLVSYTLSDTLSDHGGVSRGVCQVDEEGWLAGIQEVLEIRRTGEGFKGRTLTGRPLRLTGGEPISTNFWIFTPEVFPFLEKGFSDFLAGQADPSTAQSEFLIPTVVNGALEAGAIQVKTAPTKGRFLGITHPEDREWVVESLASMALEGRYPDPLWG
jgi:NDP-sugar pyrophosphorylase family protein